MRRRNLRLMSASTGTPSSPGRAVTAGAAARKCSATRAAVACRSLAAPTPGRCGQAPEHRGRHGGDAGPPAAVARRSAAIAAGGRGPQPAAPGALQLDPAAQHPPHGVYCSVPFREGATRRPPHPAPRHGEGRGRAARTGRSPDDVGAEPGGRDHRGREAATGDRNAGATRGSPLPALGMWGPGEPVAVDNESGILRVLASKREKCGDLVAPLVVAVQSNTEYPTYDYQFDNALYGIGSSPHERRADDLSHLLQGGFWISKSGWRNAHVPQVVSVGGLSPWSVTRVQPCCWSTVQPSIELPVQPEWLAPMILGNPSLPGPATPMASHFGLDGGWPGMDVPDFDLTD